MSEKQKTSIQLTPDAKDLLQRLARSLGISRSAVIELAIREKAARHGRRLHPHEDGAREARQ